MEQAGECGGRKGGDNTVRSCPEELRLEGQKIQDGRDRQELEPRHRRAIPGAAEAFPIGKGTMLIRGVRRLDLFLPVHSVN